MEKGVFHQIMDFKNLTPYFPVIQKNVQIQVSKLVKEWSMQ